MNNDRAVRLPISIVLGAALMTLASALVGFDVATERMPPSCVSSGGAFAALAVVGLLAGLLLSVHEAVRNAVHQPPNPRLQRTPPASPPSPLSRQPLGGME
jgi:hypothetical protein